MNRGRLKSRTRFVAEVSSGRFRPIRLSRQILCGFLVSAFFGFSTLLPRDAQSQSLMQGQALLQNPAASEYAVVGLLVEFQPDSSRFSTGDGLFDGVLFEGTELPTVDPLPHNDHYFQAHLTFLENYVDRVSDGRTTVSSIVLPGVVQVSGQMKDYSPIGLESESDAEVSKLANLVTEAWTLAADAPGISLPEGLDPEKTAFVLFHAGVGRDIELLGNTLDKTPEDLPSLFFDAAALSRLTGARSIDFNGFPISNSMVIPRTETRRGVNFLNDEAFLVELSINGLLAASFFNYLGVPDLFNTSSGESGIGPFGVMDGLGIFAYFGLLPPEPSAWTKMYLGWADLRFPAGQEEEQVTLQYGADPLRSDVFVAPVAEGEYFLVENRNRDPEMDGVHLTVWNHDGVKQVVFENGDPDFNSNTIEGFPGGVILSADNYDFVLPGGKDQDDNVLNGGVLIWHVNEARIESGLDDNTVNADSSRRGVSLQEADGANDIGFPSTAFLGPDYSSGSPFDYFYEGNPFTVITSTGQEISLYENRFGPDTYPSSSPADGGPGFVELRDFTLAGPEMSFVFDRRESGGFAETSSDFVASGFEDESGERFDGRGGVLRRMPSDDIDYLAFAAGSTGSSSPAPTTGRLFLTKDGAIVNRVDDLLTARPAIRGSEAFGVSRDGFVVVRETGLIESFFAFPSTLNILSSTTALVVADDGGLFVGVETESGPALLSLVDGQFDVSSTSDTILFLGLTDGLRPTLVYSDRAEILGTSQQWQFDPLSEEEVFSAFFWRSGDVSSDPGISGVIPDLAQQRLLLLLPEGTVSTIELEDYASYGFGGRLNPEPLVADLDADHIPEIIVTAGGWIYAFRSNGFLHEDFPIKMRTEAAYQPLIARTDGGSAWSILVTSIDGRLDAYDAVYRDKRVPGFPLAVGRTSAGPPFVTAGTLGALSSTGTLMVWGNEGLDVGQWEDAYGINNANFVHVPSGLPQADSGSGGASQRLLDPTKTYNWPNPIRDGKTRIRVEPHATSDIFITIVDMAGTLVSELTYSGASGGVPTEIEWITDAPSGVYIARIKAVSAGQTEYHLIKMAIIR